MTEADKTYEALPEDLKKAVDYALYFYSRPLHHNIKIMARLADIDSVQARLSAPKRKTAAPRKISPDDLEETKLMLVKGAHFIHEKGGLEGLDKYLGADSRLAEVSERPGIKNNDALQSFIVMAMNSLRVAGATSICPKSAVYEQQANSEIIKTFTYLGIFQDLFFQEYGLANQDGKNTEYDEVIKKKAAEFGKYPPEMRAKFSSGDISDQRRCFEMLGVIMKLVIESFRGNKNYMTISFSNIIKPDNTVIKDGFKK